METGAGLGIEVRLAYRLPYDVDSLLRFVATRAVPEVEAVTDRCIRRSVRAGTLAPAAGWIEVEFDALLPVVRLRHAAELAAASGRVVAAVRRWLDLDAPPLAIDAALSAGADALPGKPGLRLPGGVDGFELAVRAVLGQQITVAAARTAARRLVGRFGVPVRTPWPQVSHSFPSPEVLADAATENIAALGIIRSRAAAIGALASAWPGIAPLLARSAPAEPLIEALCALPGIGPWTAHYVAMRALGWPDAFPPNDVAVLKAMNRLYATVSAKEAEQRARAWQPWRSYAVLRLWDSLARPGSAPEVTLDTGLATMNTLDERLLDAPDAGNAGNAENAENAENAVRTSASAGRPVRKAPTSSAVVAVHRGCTAQLGVDTSLGRLLLARTRIGLAGVWFEGQRHHPGPLTAPFDADEPLLTAAAAQLQRYFAGEAIAFDLPLDLQGTPFQRAVWQALMAIDRGTTASYGGIARQLGHANAVRAVGAAVGRNPLSVIVPCHRVVGSDGSLTGYAGGIDRKHAMLALEGCRSPSDRLGERGRYPHAVATGDGSNPPIGPAGPGASRGCGTM